MHLFWLLPTFLLPHLAHGISTTYLTRPPASTGLPSGISTHGTCDGRNKAVIQGAISHLKEFATAGLANAKADEPLYKFFFRSDDLANVTTFFNNTLDISQGKGQSVVLVCEDLQNLCSKEDFAAYLFRSSRLPTERGTPQIIVICPKFYEAPALPKPCDKNSLEPGRWGYGSHQAGILLNIMAPIPYITGSENSTVIENQGNFILFARVINTGEPQEFQNDAGMRERFQPRNNAYSYQFLATWAWLRERQQRQCRRAYPLWRILDDPTVEKLRATLPTMYFDNDNGDRTKNELRKLLSAPIDEDLPPSEEGEGLQVWGLQAEDNGDPNLAVAVPSNTTLQSLFLHLTA